MHTRCRLQHGVRGPSCNGRHGLALERLHATLLGGTPAAALPRSLFAQGGCRRRAWLDSSLRPLAHVALAASGNRAWRTSPGVLRKTPALSNHKGRARAIQHDVDIGAAWLQLAWRILLHARHRQVGQVGQVVFTTLVVARAARHGRGDDHLQGRADQVPAHLRDASVAVVRSCTMRTRRSAVSQIVS
jgi:hypothetical protein